MKERRAYWCQQCTPPVRQFLLPGEKIPSCPKDRRHGKMERQPNRRYKGSRK